MRNSLLVILLLFLSLSGYSQCTLTVNVTASSSVICSGATVVLTASPSGGTAPYTYAWNTGETTQTISVNKVGTYTVTVTDNTPGCTGVVKTITVTGAPVPAPPTVSGATVCPNSPATLTATAPGGTYQWYDAATGGNFLATGASYTTPPITTPTIFYVQTTLNGCTSDRTAVTVSLIKNPVGKPAIVCYNSSAALSATGGDTYSWYASSTGGAVLGTGATFNTPILTATTTYYVVATTNGCVSQPVGVTATVLPEPPLPSTTNVAVCSGTVATLHATVPSGIIDWFNVPTGGSSLISGTDFTTPVLTATTTYYVQNTIGTCSSTRVPVTVTVNALPQSPVAAGVSICSGSNATLTATAPGGTYEWYSSSTGGTLLATGGTFVTPALTATTIYYLQSDNGTCTSTRVPVQVTVQRLPAAPSGANVLICSGTAATLVASSLSGGNYQWYDAPTAGNLLASTSTFTTPVLTANTTYYVQTTVGGCESPRAAIQVSILPPTTPPAASNASVCSGNSTTLTASGGSGNYQWYDAANGGNLLSTAQVFVTPALTTTTTYYLQTTSVNGCASTRIPVIVTVNPPPAAPVASGVAVCPGTSVILTATASGTVQWYDAATGGNLLATGNNYTTPVIYTTTTYFAQNTNGTCPSSRTPVTVTINNIANPQFIYSSGTFCVSSANQTPIINNPAGGTFSATPAGLVFVSTTTGEINIATSIPGTYTISFAGNGPCPITTSTTINISATFNSQFSYSGPFCQGGVNPLPVFATGATAGIFSASSAGLVFVNTSTGEINLNKSTPGTYTITNTLAGSGICATSVSTSTVTIAPAVVVSAGPDQTISAGATAQLAGSVTGGATTGTWSGGTGTFSNPNSLNAVYTPGAGETSAVLTLTSANPGAPCGSISAKVTITINPIPAAPTVPAASVCMGGNTTLSATAPGGTYQWYDASSGGNLLATGPSYTTPPLTANTTYYVQTTVGTATSARTAVTVTVNAPPAPPTAPSQTACYGYVTTLTASGSTGTYEWYDAPIGGNLLAIGSTFTTGLVASNLSYYVQTTVNGCSSTRTQVNITVSYIANITSQLSASICSSNVMNYTITSDLPGTTYVWGRAAVPGISNLAVANQTSSVINETLINTTNAPINVTYLITPTTNGCTGESFHYVVTVYPLPTVTSASSATVCNESPVSYTITFNIPGVNFTWGRAAVPGISDAPVSGQTSPTINETLTNTTNAPINVTYVFTYSAGNCTGLTFNYVVTVNPSVSVTSPQVFNACSGVPLNYVIAANTPSATFTWSRNSYVYITNPAVSNQTSSPIEEVLVNKTTDPVYVNYTITPSAYGCTGMPVIVQVEVFPQPATPVANSNSPVCVGSTIQLQTPLVPGANYLWTGPNGFTSTAQNPSISNVTTANTGTYTLLVSVNGCTSPPATVQAVVDEPPVADAGPDQTVCTSIPNVQLAGSVSGGTTTGIWTTSGSGTFTGGLSSTNVLNAQYFPSAQDRAAGSVKLTLGSTSKDDCTVSTAILTITFQSAQITSASTGAVCTGTAQNYSITSNIPGSTYVWSRAAVPGITNPAISNQTSSSITETLFNPGTTPIDVIYIITPSAAGCQGIPFNYTVTVNPQPVTPAATASTPVCVGSNIQLQTPLIPGATYAWTGPAGFTSTSQNPIVSNVTQANTGAYSVIVTVNGCPSQPGTVNAVVDLPPVAAAGPNQIVCATTTAVTLTGSITGGTTTGVWSTNGTGTFTGGGNTTTSLNAQYFPSAQDVTNGTVILTLTSTSNDNCTVATSTMTITFQAAQITSAATGAICTGTAQNYSITSNIPGSTYTWSRPAVTGISNGPVANQTSSSITETLFNTGTTPVDVIYTIVPAFNGCSGEPFTYTVTVNPQPVTPTITALTAVCVGSIIHLQTPAIPGATYAWTGPGGFTSNSQNPDVSNVTTANAGVYTLIVSVNGCPSQPAMVTAVVDLPPVAAAGPDQTICPSTTAVTLAGSVTGGTTTGLWTTSGSGTFTGGGSSTTVLTGQYFPSAQDVSNGSVTLTLASTSNDDCAISTSTMTIKFQLLKAVTAGPDQSICSQGTAQLAGQITIPGGGIWTTSGTGTFNPSAGSLNATYVPSAADIKSGSVVLTLTANAPGQCYIPSDNLTIKLIPPPTVNAGGTVYILRNHTITLNPIVSDPNVQYSWSPDIDISSTTIKNPVITGDVNRTYILTVTDTRGCVTQDQVKVIVAPELVVPNAFTPNGDGINDQWNIVGLSAYQQATVDIFDRSGQKVYHSIGYGIPWDGTYKGKEVPFGVYYYVIDTKVNNVILSGYVTVIR